MTEASAAYARLLRDPRWQAFRREIIELDGGACADCGRGPEDGKSLHVHHREYIPGAAPWEYPPGMLETLCAGCHAAEHGIIPPPAGWVLIGDRDEGDLSSACEYCSEPIRYVFTIWHDAWGKIDVGTDCCDRMTLNSAASETVKLRSRRERFVASPRWRAGKRSSHISQCGIRVHVLPWQGRYRLRMSKGYKTLLGQQLYGSEERAKAAAFDAIVSGLAERAIERSAP